MIEPSAIVAFREAKKNVFMVSHDFIPNYVDDLRKAYYTQTNRVANVIFVSSVLANTIMHSPCWEYVFTRKNNGVLDLNDGYMGSYGLIDVYLSKDEAFSRGIYYLLGYIEKSTVISKT